MKLSPRILPGILSVHNKGTLDWGHHGLIAYGCTNIVAVVDSKTLQMLHGLNGHKTAVTKVRWTPSRHIGDSSKERNLCLASADTSGAILVWDVFNGNVRCTLTESNKVVNGLEWLQHGKIPYLLALYQSSTLILWHGSSGEQVWKKNYSDNLINFCLDPFDSSHAAFQGVGFLVFVNDIGVSKCPASNGKKFQISSLGSSSPSEKDAASTTKDFTQLVYHRAHHNHIMLINAQEIMIIDLDIKHTVGIISLDKMSSPFLQVWSCRQRDVLYSLHESSSLSMKLRKRQTAALAGNDGANGSTEVNFQNPPNLTAADVAADISYETLLVTDSPRLNRSQRAISLAVCPMTETKVAILTSDGKLVIYDVQKEFNLVAPLVPLAGQGSTVAPVTCLADLVPPSTSRRVSQQRLRQCATLVSMTSGLPEPPLVVRMCPPLTTKNWNVYQPWLAIGSQKGIVQVYNLSTGRLQKEISVHGCQIRGIEWTSMSSIITYAHDSASSGSNFKSEVAHVDFKTGLVTVFRTSTTEEAVVTAVRVSYLKQYLVILFKGKQAELWDVRSLTLLREMPPVFPYATALEWSNSARRAVSATDAPGGAGDSNTSARQLLSKEQMLVTDEQGFVHSFIVEATAVNQAASVGIQGSITAMAWKIESLVLGSTEGTLSFMDLKARTTQVRSTDKGHVRKMRFAPGKGNKTLLVLLHKELQIWDASEIVLMSSLRFPKDVSRVNDVDWANSEMLAFSTADGYVSVTKLDLKTCNFSLTEVASSALPTCGALLSPDDQLVAKTLLCHQPWKTRFCLESDDSGQNNVRSSADIGKCLNNQLQEYIQSTGCSIAERCLIVSRLLGDCFEVDFWTMALHYLKRARASSKEVDRAYTSASGHKLNGAVHGTDTPRADADRSGMLTDDDVFNRDCDPLEACYDLFCDNRSYRDAELSRVITHDSRRNTADVSAQCAHKYMLLGETDRAVHLLLDTDPSSPHYLANCLKACLLTSARSAGASLSTVKLVATNLIASGKLSDGVLLLCLIDKGLDACRYLQTYHLWEDSIQLAKMLLTPADNVEVVGRWIDHLCSPSVNRKEKAILAALSTAQFMRAIELLYSSHCFTTAALFVEACQEFGVLDAGGDRTLHVTQAVFLQYARVLRERKLLPAAKHYLAKAGGNDSQLELDLKSPDGMNNP